jgi:hypothetical protein
VVDDPVRLYENWRTILRKSWSLRFQTLAFGLIFAEAALPFFEDYFSRKQFAVLLGLVVASAFIARLVAQKDI